MLLNHRLFHAIFKELVRSKLFTQADNSIGTSLFRHHPPSLKLRRTKEKLKKSAS
jgi:hypothetical protein